MQKNYIFHVAQLFATRCSLVVTKETEWLRNRKSKTYRHRKTDKRTDEWTDGRQIDRQAET